MFPLSVFNDAVQRLRKEGIEVIVHTILGLPGESNEDILATMEYLNQMDIQGIKLQLLHVLRGTDLATDYVKGMFQTYERADIGDAVGFAGRNRKGYVGKLCDVRIRQHCGIFIQFLHCAGFTAVDFVQQQAAAVISLITACILSCLLLSNNSIFTSYFKGLILFDCKDTLFF